MGEGIPTVLLGCPLLLLTLASAAFWLTGGVVVHEWWQLIAVAWAVIAPLVALDIWAAT